MNTGITKAAFYVLSSDGFVIQLDQEYEIQLINILITLRPPLSEGATSSYWSEFVKHGRFFIISESQGYILNGFCVICQRVSGKRLKVYGKEGTDQLIDHLFLLQTFLATLDGIELLSAIECFFGKWKPRKQVSKFSLVFDVHRMEQAFQIADEHIWI